MTPFSIAKDFSRAPAGRTKEDGPHSGAALREIFVELLKKGPIKVDLNGTLGYGSSFLEAAFGGLGGEHFDFVSDQESLVTEIRDYLPSREELIRDRDRLLDALKPFAIGLACFKSTGVVSLITGSTSQCGECAVCKAHDLVIPIVTWIRKGYQPRRRVL